MCVGYGKMGHFKKVYHSKRSRMVNEMEQKMSQEYSEGKIEKVNIKSVHKDNNWSMLIAKLETCTSNNKLTVPHKIDIGSDGSIMLWYIFKKLIPWVSEARLKKPIKNHIKLKTYNKTVITQLGTCSVIIDYKYNKKKCKCFVVPRNSQALGKRLQYKHR